MDTAINRPNGKAYQAMLEEAKKRRAKALQLRLTGNKGQPMTVQQVANVMGITKQRASELISRAKQEAGL